MFRDVSWKYHVMILKTRVSEVFSRFWNMVVMNEMDLKSELPISLITSESLICQKKKHMSAYFS